MSATVSIDLLLRFLQATSEQRSAIERILDGTKVDTAAVGRLVFYRAGDYWDVVYDGGPLFHVKDSLGARYLNYLLHHPNEVISTYDLEVAIRPEKAKARAKDSIQPTLDAEAVRACLRELTQLRSELEAAEAIGHEVERRRLEGEIEALEGMLNRRGHSADTGSRACDNVRKAIGGVVRQLGKGGQHERALATHLRRCVRLGYNVSYIHPDGSRWH